MKSAFILLFAVALTSLVYAQQSTETSPYIISNLDISQLFGGELDSPAYFQMRSDEPFLLHVQVLAPYADGYDANAHRVSMLVLNGARKEIAFSYEDSYFWSTKQVDGNYYFAGPEVTENVPAGTYTIKLYSAANGTRYVLNVGTKKSSEIKIDTSRIFTLSVLENFLQLLGLVMITGCVTALYVANTVSRNKEMNRITVDFYYKIRYMMWKGIVLLAAGWLPMYIQGPSDVLGTAKTIFVILIAAHWAYFSIRVQPKFAKIKGKALLTEKFQNFIRNHMLVQMIEIIILLILTAVII